MSNPLCSTWAVMSLGHEVTEWPTKNHTLHSGLDNERLQTSSSFFSLFGITSETADGENSNQEFVLVFFFAD
ncbi:hypothetical protein CEXT_719831 [Caerostris extrusa]|uniref:Uncharacterized protein n=1 Tax=Caerostris extrusa TaxID=172846 RepID=A0AAV4XBW8_CAEEX|nr:hypothetical protein CEXT_719831 [Caerostris extrusa]